MRRRRAWLLPRGPAGRPDLEIVALEKGGYTSYSACGIPYSSAGLSAGVDDLVVRTPQEFRDRHRIDVRTRHEVMAIDLDARRARRTRSAHEPHDPGRRSTSLLIATGARPIRPRSPGHRPPASCTASRRSTTRAGVAATHCRQSSRNVVVVGGGYIGLEMAEAFLERGSQRGACVEGSRAADADARPGHGRPRSRTPCGATVIDVRLGAPSDRVRGASGAHRRGRPVPGRPRGARASASPRTRRSPRRPASSSA